MATKYRLPQQYGEAYIGFAHTWRFLVEQVLNDNVTPVDLSSYDAIRLHIYAFETSASLILNVTCTVLTGSSDLEDGTKARCTVTWTPTSADFAEADYHARLVGVSGASLEIFEKPWTFRAYKGGPTS